MKHFLHTWKRIATLKPIYFMPDDLLKASMSAKYLKGQMGVDFVSTVQYQMNLNNGPPIMDLSLNISIWMMDMLDNIF